MAFHIDLSSCSLVCSRRAPRRLRLLVTAIRDGHYVLRRPSSCACGTVFMRIQSRRVLMGLKIVDCLFSQQLFKLVCNYGARRRQSRSPQSPLLHLSKGKGTKKIMPSKFLAKNPLKILSQNRLTSYITATCDFLISVLFPCQHSTHSDIDRVPPTEYQSTRVPFRHFVSFTGAPFLILYTYKLLLSSCHFSKSQMVLWYSDTLWSLWYTMRMPERVDDVESVVQEGG